MPLPDIAQQLHSTLLKRRGPVVPCSAPAPPPSPPGPDSLLPPGPGPPTGSVPDFAWERRRSIAESA
eukprot:707185-Rhodomonas_salina.3